MFACKVFRWSPGTRPVRLRPARVRPVDGGWTCLELTGQPAELPLGTARELLVRRPDELTLAVLAAAPELAAVVLPEQGRLPAPVAAELARRRIATIWRQLPAARPSTPAQVGPAHPGPAHPGPAQAGPAQAARAQAGSVRPRRATCAMSRPGSAS